MNEAYRPYSVGRLASWAYERDWGTSTMPTVIPLHRQYASLVDMSCMHSRYEIRQQPCKIVPRHPFDKGEQTAKVAQDLVD
jgi:hypothetical protein